MKSHSVRRYMKLPNQKKHSMSKLVSLRWRNFSANKAEKTWCLIFSLGPLVELLEKIIIPSDPQIKPPSYTSVLLLLMKIAPKTPPRLWKLFPTQNWRKTLNQLMKIHSVRRYMKLPNQKKHSMSKLLSLRGRNFSANKAEKTWWKSLQPVR